jgi:CubicO group peptidase (beta-lactamase class C family)
MEHTAVSPESIGMSSERLARIAPAIEAYAQRRGFAGVSMAVARRGRLVYIAQVGAQDRESGAPMQADTIVRIYSMTKPVICTALMALYEEGRLRLADPVAAYIPAFGAVKVLGAGGALADLARPITVRDLLTHTSGLTYDFLENSPVCELYRQAQIMGDGRRTLQAVVADIARQPLAYQPGSRWHYSVGIDVAAHLIEVISGRPLGEFLRERIFAPLGMEDTGFSVPEEKRGRVATMYGLPDIASGGMSVSTLYAHWLAGYNERIDVSQSYPADAPGLFERGGHGLFSTAEDYLRFGQMLLNGGELDGARVLGRKTCELMHTNHLPAALLPYELGGAPVPGYGFGLGSRVAMDVGLTGLPGSVGEFGWAGAARTYFWVDPREQLVGVVMTQAMMMFEMLDQTFRALVYQAIVD